MKLKLKGQNPLRIVAAMKKSAILLGFLLLTSTSASAQYQQFGVLVGTSERFFGRTDQKNQVLPGGFFHFGGLVEEGWYGINIEPDTVFKIKAGQFNTSVGEVTATSRPVKGKVRHIDAVIDYRFSEPFGTTGLFAGIGLYRATAPSIPRQNNYGFNLGVNGDFPMTRTFGTVVEVTYHVTNLQGKPRFLTATGGLRARF